MDDGAPSLIDRAIIDAITDRFDDRFDKVDAEQAEQAKLTASMREHVDREFRKLRRELREATRPITPDTGESFVFGMKLGRGEKIALGAAGSTIVFLVGSLVALLLWIGRGIEADMTETRARVAVAEEHVKSLVAFARLGDRATKADVETLYECMLLRFQERFTGIKSGQPLSAPEGADDHYIEACLTRLRDGLDEIQAR